MASRISRWTVQRLQNIFRIVISDLVDAKFERAMESLFDIQATLSRIDDQIMEKSDRTYNIVSALFDELSFLRDRLRRARETHEYERAFLDPEPLVSVRIATYGDPTILIERAIASVRAQTYERVEVVVVGDMCSEETGNSLARLRDSRIRYFNLDVRSPYPDSDRQRWLVAGSPAMNMGASLATGLWIAPLDHDDEFLADHIEVLLKEAQRRHLELVYGKALAILGSSGNVEVGTFPPQRGQFGFQAAMHPTALRFFGYNEKSWLLDEPGDWNICRRMVEASVRVGFVDQIVTRIYPSWSDNGPTEPQ